MLVENMLVASKLLANPYGNAWPLVASMLVANMLVANMLVANMLVATRSVCAWLNRLIGSIHALFGSP